MISVLISIHVYQGTCLTLMMTVFNIIIKQSVQYGVLGNYIQSFMQIAIISMDIKLNIAVIFIIYLWKVFHCNSVHISISLLEMSVLPS